MLSKAVSLMEMAKPWPFAHVVIQVDHEQYEKTDSLVPVLLSLFIICCH